jgi:hypothetical protein
MGLFDKRKMKGDDFDSPVENIDLSEAPEPEPEPADAHAGLAPPTAASPPSARDDDAPRRAPEPAEDFDAPPYGIDDAIQLMRALPQDNVELVVQVVKRTLESTRVKVKTIIDDATRKQSDIEGRIGVLTREISEYEQEIATRKHEIDRLEADHSETTTVKERLVLAEKLGGDKRASDGPPPRPAAITGAPPPQVAVPALPTSPSPPTLPGPTGMQAQPAGKSTTIVAKK